MRRVSAILTLALLVAAASAARAQEEAAPAGGAQLAVAEAVITTGVQDRQPVDNVTTVPTDGRRDPARARLVQGRRRDGARVAARGRH
jgi:hypothetical protein